MPQGHNSRDDPNPMHENETKRTKKSSESERMHDHDMTGSSNAPLGSVPNGAGGEHEAYERRLAAMHEELAVMADEVKNLNHLLTSTRTEVMNHVAQKNYYEDACMKASQLVQVKDEVN